MKERTPEQLRNWKYQTAEYQIKDGKRFLKIDGEFHEVVLWKTPGWWRVVKKEQGLSF